MDISAYLDPACAKATRGPKYASALPFPHVAIEQFFVDEFCQRLVDEFPTTERSTLFVEYGRAIGKATREDLRSLGGAYIELYDLLTDKQFLDWLSTITGIEHLQPDEMFVGGGTHENLPGQALHPHVDFNRHPTSGFYRRLNLLVYLNPVWREEWGGKITLYEDPRLGRAGAAATYEPTWNRAVLFGTTERSWHGFDRLRLEDAPSGTTRRSISAYYYSEEPPDDIGAKHATVYLPPPVLSGRDEFEQAALTEEWRALLGYLHSEQARLSETLEAVENQLQEAQSYQLLPLRGYIEQVGSVTGYFPGGWTARELRAQIKAHRQVSSLSVTAFSPRETEERVLTLSANGRVYKTAQIVGGEPLILSGDANFEAGEVFTLELKSSSSLAMDGDSRELGIVLMNVEAQHR